MPSDGCALDERRVWWPGVARGLLGRRTGGPPLGLPPQARHRLPAQRHWVPGCQATFAQRKLTPGTFTLYPLRSEAKPSFSAPFALEALPATDVMGWKPLTSYRWHFK